MNKNVLSISGNRAINYLLQTVLENEYHFTYAMDVFHGMNKLKLNKDISVLIVDVDFESQQSWQLIEYVKRSKIYNLPVIVLATENSNEMKQKLFDYQVNEIFFKPFNPVDLIEVIRHLTVPTVSRF